MGPLVYAPRMMCGQRGQPPSMTSPDVAGLRKRERGPPLAALNDMTVARRPKSEPPDARDEDAIFSVDTVPPPAGEDDAYSAATKVGPLARGYIDKLMADSERVPSPPRMRSETAAVPDRSELRSRVVPKPARTPSDTRPGMPAPAPASPRSPGAYSAREQDDDDYFFRTVDDEEPPHEPTSLFGAFSDAGADVARFEEAMLRSVTDEINRRKPPVFRAAASSSSKALDATVLEPMLETVPETPATADAPVVVERALAVHRTRALLVAAVLVCAALAAFYAATRG